LEEDRPGVEADVCGRQAGASNALDHLQGSAFCWAGGESRHFTGAHCGMTTLCVACRDGIGDVGSVSPYPVDLLG
jgi:hypothetical protein